ncbi:helix-turn-helix domain-containing protein [Myroides odoratus]|uniref:helix-turn-helix domain-containing protein n=1 Tax=Myroides odoratus TaxID=256 RepID=UPI000765BA26|nr:helix-turn-helix domain-containing protein [Myroides odoratus]
MKIDFYQPKSQTLAKYIEGYYFLHRDKNLSKPIRYWTYPNNYCILTFNRNFSVQENEEGVVLRAHDCLNSMTSLVSRYTKPMQICYEDLIDELTIYFKPLGINQFMTDAQSLFEKRVHIDFVFSPDFNQKMNELFDLNIEAQIDALESYLLVLLHEKKLDLIEKIVGDLDADSKIEEIAKKHNITRQYMNRLFVKHLGKSPAEYRKIQRFRNSILKRKESKNYTELAQYGFYDQAHFNKDFKLLTGHTPQTFFNQVNTSQENIWLFI